MEASLLPGERGSRGRLLQQRPHRPRLQPRRPEGRPWQAVPLAGSARAIGFLPLVAVWLLGVGQQPCAATGGGRQRFTPQAMGASFTGVLLPGFASSRLHAWALYDCPLTPLDFNPLDTVWLDAQKVVGATSCWLKCISLDPRSQKDQPECKSRTDQGLPAITELDPGIITGPLSSVWRQWVNWCVEFGIDSDALVAVPYDWRLYPRMLEERDLFFHKLRITFEAARKLRGPGIVFAHSMGNSVFRYFLEWLRHHVAPKSYQRWIDRHIHAYYAIAAPLLGAPEALKGLMSGITFGLPISEGTAKVMGNSFGSSLWMYPISPFCHTAQPPPWHHYSADHQAQAKPQGPRYRCRRSERNFSGWPVPVMVVSGVQRQKDPARSANSCPSGIRPRPFEARPDKADSARPPGRGKVGDDEDDEEEGEGEGGEEEAGEVLYSAEEIAGGQFLADLGALDADAAVFRDKLTDWYLDDPILNPLTPWGRPPIKNVFCAFGIDLRTEVGFAYSPSGKPYPENWELEDIFYEDEGGQLRSSSGLPVKGNRFPASGDVTVPYYSLSWCKSWLGPKVNITRAPMQAHSMDDVQREDDVEHTPGRAEGEGGKFLYPSHFGRAPGTKYITYYEDSASRPGQRTAVWELDKVDHRSIVSSHVLLREVLLEVFHESHPNASLPFVRKDYREPMRDEDCFWDYTRASCAVTEHCEYRYVFGDIHLGQSCRLKQTGSAGVDSDLFSRYM